MVERAACAVVTLLAFGLLVCGPASAAGVTVFAAASLGDAVQEIVDGLGSGPGTRLSRAASSTLARQIEAGAPADIFLSANAAWMDRLEARGLIVPGTRRSPIGNRLALIGPLGAAPLSLGEPRALLARLGPTGRMAIGDPAHVPAGLYARQALERLGLWGAVRERLALADNVRGALALVARGDAPLGIVYGTDVAVSPAVVEPGEIPADSHDPIAYVFAIVRGSERREVRSLFEALSTRGAIAVFERHGFRSL